VRNVEADSVEDARGKARGRAEALLDELCWQYEIELEIGNGCTVMKQDSPGTRHIKKYEIEVYVGGGHGKKTPGVLDKVEIRASDAKTYYRKATISEDAFDKFRNFYLAIENVASKVAAARAEAFHYESDLLKFALEECFCSDKKALKEHSHGYGFRSTGDIFEDATALLWEKNRVQISHSKESRQKKVPFNPAHEREVQGSLHLAEFVARSLIGYEDANLLS